MKQLWLLNAIVMAAIKHKTIPNKKKFKKEGLTCSTFEYQQPTI